MDYRVYVMDTEGHIKGVHELYSSNDEEAQAMAAQMLDGHDLELWNRERRVAILKHREGK